MPPRRRASTAGGKGGSHQPGGDFSWMSAADSTTGFDFNFSLPFKREEVWEELTSEHVLGLDDGKAVEYRLIRVGDDPANPISVGCVREANYSASNARTVSELVELKKPSYIKWATLVQTNTFFEFLSRTDDTSPSIALALKEIKRSKLHPEGGTEITIRYDFAEVKLNGPCCILSFVFESLIKTMLSRSLPRKWKNSMILRGHTPLQARGGNADAIKKQMEAEAKHKKERRKKEGAAVTAHDPPSAK